MNLKDKIIDKLSPATNKLTEGEIFISDFLKSKNIKVQDQVKIGNLKNDSKFYRVADFYLPKYKVYIEYLGQWDKSEEANIRYKEKKQVYTKNNIPCIYLYSENLGIIEYIFDKRLKVELKKYNLKKELFSYRKKLFIDERGSVFLWFFLSVFILCTYNYHDKPKENFSFVTTFSLIILFQLYRFIKGYKKHFLTD